VVISVFIEYQVIGNAVTGTFYRTEWWFITDSGDILDCKTSLINTRQTYLHG